MAETVAEQFARARRAEAYAREVDAENDFLVHHGAAARARRAEYQRWLNVFEENIRRDERGLPALPLPKTSAQIREEAKAWADEVEREVKAKAREKAPAPRATSGTRTPARAKTTPNGERIVYRAFDDTGKLYGS